MEELKHNCRLKSSLRYIFNLFTGFFIIFSTYFVCLKVFEYTKIHFPAPVLGVMVLFLCLQFKIIPVHLVKDASNFLLRYMIFFFVPLAVGIVKYYDVLRENFMPIAVTVFVTTFIVLIAVGLFVDVAIKYSRLIKMKRTLRK